MGSTISRLRQSSPPTPRERSATEIATDRLKKEIADVELSDATFHIGLPEPRDARESKYWGGMKLSVTRHATLKVSDINVFACMTQDVVGCKWSLIDTLLSHYSVYKDEFFRHLGGAFFKVIDKEEHCQMILPPGEKHDMKCEPSEAGARSAFLNEDLINYNMFMGVLYPQIDKDVWTYFHGKQKSDHCSLFSVNNALSFNVYNPITFAKHHLDLVENIAGGEAMDHLTFKKDADGKLVPSEFYELAVPTALNKMGVKTSIRPVWAFNADQIPNLDKNPFFEDAFGYIFRFKGTYDNRKTKLPEDGVHFFVFKYIAGHWYGFDANREKVIGPSKTFTEGITETFERHNKAWTHRDDEEDPEKITYQSFQIDIGKILTDHTRKALEGKDSVWYALTRDQRIHQYRPSMSYSPFVDNYHNNIGHDSEFYRTNNNDHVLLVTICLVFLILFVCCWVLSWCFGIAIGFISGECQSKSQKNNMMDVPIDIYSNDQVINMHQQ